MRNNFQSKSVPRGTRTIWRYLSALFILFTFAIGNMWANQTDLISGVTLPDMPTASLNMATQSTFTPDANGWIVFDPYADAANKSTIPSWWKHSAKNTQGETLSEETLASLDLTAPFVAKSTNHVRINSSGNYNGAIRFTGAEKASFLVNPRGNRSVVVALFSYAGETQTPVGDPVACTNGAGFKEILFSSLTTTTTYVAYIYTAASSNCCLVEIAIKAPVNIDGPFAVTYDKNNEGASGTMTDANSPYAKDATVTVLGNSFTAPTGKVFAGWNTKADGSGTSYAAGNTFNAVKDVNLFAQWAYPATGTGTINCAFVKDANTINGTVTGVSTISGISSSLTASTLSLGGGDVKDGYSVRITNQQASYNDAHNVAYSFTVADNYTFAISSVSAIVFANGTGDMKAKVVITDGVSEIESNQLSCPNSADGTITFAADAFDGVKLEGTVTVKFYFWNKTGKRAYIKSPVTITGTVAAAAPKYDVIFANGGEGTGDMATLKYEAGEEVTLPACGYTPVSGREFDGWTSSDVTISEGKFEMPAKNVTITATWRDEAVKYTVAYDVNGGSSATPTETDKAAGDEFALAAAPEYDGYHFEGWLCDVDAVTYDAQDAYTMTAANTTFTAQWKPYSTISIANKTYIIGIGDFNAVSDFSSNCEAAVSYELKESYSGVTLTPAGVFSATVAGEYIVVANQAGDATYAATSKEFTVTVLDDELSDTYVWKKNTSYGGDGKCISASAANVDPNANAAYKELDFSSQTMTGMSAMGRPAHDNDEVTLTFAVKDAYNSLFAIKSLCVYGKLDEAEGAEISWDNGANWTAIAKYSESKRTFDAPTGVYPANFKIRFTAKEVSQEKGGLWWRNALVTLEAKKTVTSTVVELNNVKVNGTAISGSELSSLLTNKTLDIATVYTTAPTVTFVKRTTTNYEGGWASTYADTDEEVDATEVAGKWSATSSAINAQTYTVTLGKPAGPSLETETTSLALVSAKVATDSKKFTFSGANLEGNVTIALESAVEGMIVSPAEVTPTAGAIVDQEVTVTYKSLANVAEANVNLIVRYSDDVKIVLPITYSSTEGIGAVTPISAATTWNWANALSAEYGTMDQNNFVVLANVNGWKEGFNANALAGALQYYYRGSSYAQGDSLFFKTTIPGKVYVTYSNTGSKNGDRTAMVNESKFTTSSNNTNDEAKKTESLLVSAGDVRIKGIDASSNENKMLRFYEVRFVPVYSVTYSEGEGAVKSGEDIPTQADEAADEKITIASADVLEKDGYDFIGWLCNVDGETYNAGDEYTMTAAATTFTAQWVEHIVPVDPALTYNDGAYTTGLAALDLSTLIDVKESTGAITYTVKTAGETGASIDGVNFTATAAGTAVITASQAAVSGYNAKTVDFNVVVTEPSEVDGIKMVVNNALTGNFRVKADQLKTGAYTVEGINYAKYVQMGSTHTSFSGETEGNQSKGIYYAPMKKNITFWFYMRNTESSTTRKIYVYTIEEGKEITSKTVDVEAGSHLVSTDITLTTNAEIVFGVENTKLCFCQIVAVESGEDLLQGGQNGYVFDYSKKRQNVAANTLRTIDGIDYKLSAESKINSASNVQLTTLGTHYIKFHLDAPMTVNVYADNKKYYVGTECSTEDAAMTYEATGDGEFTLAAGNWYINGSGAQVKINKLSFMLPKCQKPTISAQPATKQTFGPGNLTATVVADDPSDGGTLKYQWYDAATNEEVENATEATLTTTTEGTYYVIVTNTLADHSDNSVKSANATLGYRVMDDATLSALSYGTPATAIALEADKYDYRVDLVMGTIDVPALAATATMAPYPTVVITNATEFVNYEATSTVVVTAEDGVTTKTYTVKFVVDHIYTALVDVTGSTTWNWKNAAAEDVTIDDVANKGTIIANYLSGANFEKIEGKANEKAFRDQNDGVYQGTHLHFNTTVPGKVKFYFRAPSSGEECVITVINNGKEIRVDSTGNSLKWSREVVVYGDVVIEMENKKEGKTDTRVQQIVFTEDAPDYTRNVSNNIGTLCVDHNVLVGGAMGATFYQIASRNELYDYKIDFEEVLPNEELKAGEPYIFKSTTGKIELFYGATAVTEPEAVRGMHGWFDVAAPIDETKYDMLDITEENKSDILYIAQNKLWNCEDLVTGDLKVVNNRAYIVMSEVPTYAEYQEAQQNSNSAPRRRVTLGKDAEQIATGFENINAGDKPMKLMINGQIFILRGEKMYDATGRLVK